MKFNAHALKSAREALGIGVEEMAAKVGVSRQSLWSYEAGKTVPGTAVGLRLSETLGIEFSSLYLNANAPVEVAVEATTGALN